ncbi:MULTISPECIES: hypothetical protein [unclassified Oleiphilus]|uniref:hypothetical protein n=1 Tax=Oleiphilus sp. HI0117 TaxID=1822261 RepID=UPI0012E70A10
MKTDYRHKALKLIVYNETTSRSFPEWAMGAVLQVGSHEKILAKFNPDRSFQPYALSPSDSLSFLQAFSEFRGMPKST